MSGNSMKKLVENYKLKYAINFIGKTDKIWNKINI